MEGKPQQPGEQQAAKPGDQRPAQAVDPNERIDGLRSWLGQVDRKLGLRTYLGAAVTVLALAAGGAAIVLSLEAKEDAATDADVQNLREELTGVEQTAAEAAQEDVQTLNESLADVESQISRLEGEQRSQKNELSVVQDDIQDLRNQISDLESGGASSAGP
jgi:septal ring factor EnvC (AmiA/AmiB activator)